MKPGNSFVEVARKSREAEVASVHTPRRHGHFLQTAVFQRGPGIEQTDGPALVVMPKMKLKRVLPVMSTGQ